MKIALEFVEMPVRRTIEIGGNRMRGYRRAALGNEPRRFIEHQRGAIGRAEDDARMTARGSATATASALANSPDFRHSFR